MDSLALLLTALLGALSLIFLSRDLLLDDLDFFKKESSKDILLGLPGSQDASIGSADSSLGFGQVLVLSISEFLESGQSSAQWTIGSHSTRVLSNILGDQSTTGSLHDSDSVGLGIVGFSSSERDTIVRSHRVYNKVKS